MKCMLGNGSGGRGSKKRGGLGMDGEGCISMKMARLGRVW